MKTDKYLGDLRFFLAGLPASEIDDIIADQKEHIREAINAGRSEDDVLQGLGDARAFAANLKAESKIQQAQSSSNLQSQFHYTTRAVLAFLALAPLNFIFILGPFLGLCGLMIAGWVLSMSTTAVAILLLFVFLFTLIFLPVGFWVHVSAFFFIAGCIGVGVLGFFIMLTITRFFLKGTLRYLKWNLSMIRQN